MMRMEIEIDYDKIDINLFGAYYEVKDIDKHNIQIIIPKIYNIAQRLIYIKKIIKTILEENDIKNINISLSNTSQKNIIEIIKYEGAIEEIIMEEVR